MVEQLLKLPYFTMLCMYPPYTVISAATSFLVNDTHFIVLCMSHVRVTTRLSPNERDTSTQCCFDVGPPSETLDQH